MEAFIWILLSLDFVFMGVVLLAYIKDCEFERRRDLEIKRIEKEKA